VGAEAILAAVLAWVATAALHSTAWLAGALACSALLKRIVAHRVTLALVRERVFKLAIFGGLVTATLALLAGRELPIEVPGAREVAPPFPISVTRIAHRPQAFAEPAPARAEPAESTLRIPWIELAGGLWIAGVVGGAALWLRDRRRLSARLRGRERVRTGPAAELFARRLAEKPSRWISLVRAPSLTAPITRGILRTEVCIPPRAERDLLDEEIEAMLAHELAHARRSDPLLLALCRAVEVVLFFQPLLPIARRRLVEEIEILCDDRAARTTGDPAALASCLAEVATWIVAGTPEARAIAMAAGRSRLEQRVGLLLDRRQPSPGRSPLLAPTVFAVVAAALPLPAFAMRASPADFPDPEEAALPEDSGEPDEVERASESSPPAPDVNGGNAVREMDALLEEWRTIRADLGRLDLECGSLGSTAALANASPELGDRIHHVRERIEALRSLETDVERILAEIVSAER
jgi:beta-lactamase regulating signal transducer with metallopeptidase domain